MQLYETVTCTCMQQLSLDYTLLPGNVLQFYIVPMHTITMLTDTPKVNSSHTQKPYR